MAVIDGSDNAAQEMSLAEASALLDRFEARLTRTYAELRARRQTDVPVFAIEHGLADLEREQLRRALSVVMRRSPGRVSISGERDPWRCWAAYGAEVGFQFCGYVGGRTYWGEFVGGLGGAASGWGREGRPVNEDLSTIYQRFSRLVGGPVPTSRFAAKFRIVAWGISNALLPRDLQRHLVLNLARCGHEVAAALRGRHPERWTVAEVLRARKVETSSRFDSFLEDGLIVDAGVRLLLDPSGPARLGMSDALRTRLTSALSAQDRRQLDNLRAAYTRAGARGQDGRAGSGHVDGREGSGAPAPGPRVGFELEARQEQNGGWLLGLRPFGLKQEDDRLGEALFRVLRWHKIGVGDGRADPVLRAADPLLQARWRAPIRTWGSHRPIIDVRAAALTPRADPREVQARDVIRLLGERVGLPRLPLLLRVARDEIARPARTLSEGESYLWVQKGSDPPPGSPWQIAQMATEGVRASHLTVAVGQVEPALAALGAGSALARAGGRVQVCPAGNAVAAWRPSTGQSAAWLDHPPGAPLRLAVRSAVALSVQLILTVEGEAPRELSLTLSAGVVQIVGLDVPLPEGEHRLRVFVGGVDEDEILVRVRARASVRISGAWLVRMLDAEPTLDDLLRGDLQVAVYGPAGTPLSLLVHVKSALARPTLPKVQEDLLLPTTVDQVGAALRMMVHRLPLRGLTAREATLTVASDAGEVVSYTLSRADDSARRWVTTRSQWALLDDSADQEVRSAGALRIVPVEAPWRCTVKSVGGWYSDQGVIFDDSLGSLVRLPGELQPPAVASVSSVDLRVAFQAMRILQEATAAAGHRDDREARLLRCLRHWNVGAVVSALVAPGADDSRRARWWSADATAVDELGPLRVYVSALVRGARLFVAEPPWTRMARDLRPLRGAQRRERLGQQVEDLLQHAPGPAHLETLIRVATGAYAGDLGSYQRSGGIDVAELVQRLQGERWQRDAAAVVRLLVLEVHTLAVAEGEVPTSGALYAGWPWRLT